MQDLKIFVAATFFTMITALLLTILKKYKKDGLYFSKDGITLIIKNVTHTTSWDIIRPSVKVKYKYLYHVTVNLKSGSHTPYSIALYWPTEDDILEKTKKYCPKNNEFYKIVDEYAKKRDLPF